MLDESKLELKIRKIESKNLDDAYNCALRLEMIRRGSQRKDQVDSSPRRELNVRAVEADVSRSALNDEFQKKLEELQAKKMKQMEFWQENKRNQEALLSQLSQLKPPKPGPAHTTDFSQIRCFICEGMVHMQMKTGHRIGRSEALLRVPTAGARSERLPGEAGQNNG